MITGQEKPDGGTLRLGETVQLGYVDQSRDALSPNKSVWEEITGGEDELQVGKRTVASRAYVSWFNFKGAQQQRKVGTLSGGERNRVHLAKLLQKGSNLLLLDESPRTCSPSRATARWSGSKATIRITRRIGTVGWAPRPTRRTASSIGS
jgi:ATPase subunit of ABC transporter with duplicated ATPase domains